MAFAAVPAIAREMIARALDVGVPCAWVLGDTVYGSDSSLRSMLENREQTYAISVRSNRHLRFIGAAGAGRKGLRLCDWTRFALPWDRTDGWERWLLSRRSRNDPDKQACYLVFCPAGTTLAALAGVAGLRWTIEECFHRAKDGLDHCEARSWHSWHRHMSLVIAAAALP